MASCRGRCVVVLVVLLFGCLIPAGANGEAEAIEALKRSGYNSMAFILELTGGELLRGSTKTIFAPTDAAFLSSGQPSWMLLAYHVATQKLNYQEMEMHSRIGIPSSSSSCITTLLLGSQLVMSSNNEGQLMINDASITHSDLYDDGRIVIHGIDRFLDPAFYHSTAQLCNSNSNSKRATLSFATLRMAINRFFMSTNS